MCVVVCACQCVTDKPFHILFTSVSHIPLTRIRPPETLAVTSAEHTPLRWSYEYPCLGLSLQACCFTLCALWQLLVVAVEELVTQAAELRALERLGQDISDHFFSR